VILRRVGDLPAVENADGGLRIDPQVGDRVCPGSKMQLANEQKYQS
jgi:hypothetical protein